MKRNINKRISLTKRIVSLTIFIDSLFLVGLTTFFLIFTFINIDQNKAEIIENQTSAIVNTLTTVLDGIKTDARLLSTDQSVIDYLEYVNSGNNPIPNEDEEGYLKYFNYLKTVNLVKSHQGDQIYDLLFVATDYNCLLAVDGCAILDSGEVLKDDDWLLHERPWFQALDGLEEVFTEPYIDALFDDYTFTYANKVFSDGVHIGYLGIDISLLSLTNMIMKLDNQIIQNKNDILIFADFLNEPVMVFTSNEAYLDYFMVDKDEFLNIDIQKGFEKQGFDLLKSQYNQDEVVNLKFFGQEYFISIDSIPDYNWDVVVMVEDAMMFSIEMVFGFSIIAIILLLGFITLILNHRLKKVLYPIHEIISSLEQIKNGDYSVRVELIDNNEIKEIGDAINLMSEEIDRQVQLVYDNFAFDRITGLKNRVPANDDIDNYVLTGSRRTAICLIQVDNLKNINVIKGQMLGDSLIKSIADELLKIFNDSNHLYANGNDEFVYLMTDINSLKEVEYELNKLLAYFKDPLVVKNIKTEVKFYIGVANYPTDGNTIDDLIKKCDIALFKAKKLATKKIIFYNENIAREVNYQAEVSEQLSNAVINKELYLKYQPLVDNKSNLYGFEALARWSSAALGEISPEIFIANAEETYMIIPIGTWVFEEACRMQVKLREEYDKEFMMSINVSSIQILQSNFVDIVKRIIKETDVNPNYLTIELTESVFLDASILLEDKIQALHELGIKFSLDDFGTGYSSLTYLRQIEFDNLKIDKSFIDGIFGADKDHKIVGTIVSMVHNLGMKVIAEGVETKKQYEYLKQISTDVFQGYLISKPLLDKETLKFVDQFHKIAKAKRIDVLASKNEM
jgi:diguanylate cyclase (GGDEF)-like protein